jgi:hypothetical protein
MRISSAVSGQRQATLWAKGAERAKIGIWGNRSQFDFLDLP